MHPAPHTSHTARNASLVVAALLLAVVLYILSPGPVVRFFAVPASTTYFSGMMTLESPLGGFYHPIAKFDRWLPGWYWSYTNWWMRGSEVTIRDTKSAQYLLDQMTWMKDSLRD